MYGPTWWSASSCIGVCPPRPDAMLKDSALISFQSVSLTYPNAALAALQGVSLEIWEGEVLALLGANGSGKSTLGRLANALLLPSEGTVTVDGRATDGDE